MRSKIKNYKKTPPNKIKFCCIKKTKSRKKIIKSKIKIKKFFNLDLFQHKIMTINKIIQIKMKNYSKKSNIKKIKLWKWVK